MLIIKSSIDISTISGVKVNTERAMPLESALNCDSHLLCGPCQARSLEKQMTRQGVQELLGRML